MFLDLGSSEERGSASAILCYLPVWQLANRHDRLSPSLLLFCYARGALYTLQPRLFSRGENWLQSTDYFESRSPFLRASTTAVPRRSYCAIYTYVSCSYLDIRDDGRYDRLQIQASQAILCSEAM